MRVRKHALKPSKALRLTGSYHEKVSRVDRTASIIAARLLHFGFKGA